jgi:hypothetical protein
MAWTVQHYPDGAAFEIEGDDDPLVAVIHYNDGEWPSLERARNNAALIAAAPELCGALTAFVSAWDDIDNPFQPQMPRLVRRAKDALTKALGTQVSA